MELASEVADSAAMLEPMGDSGVEVPKLESEKMVELATIAAMDDNEGRDAVGGHYRSNPTAN